MLLQGLEHLHNAPLSVRWFKLHWKRWMDKMDQTKVNAVANLSNLEA